MAVLILALCLGLPVLEIWVMVEVAGQIGVLPMIGALIVLSVTGALLLRYEGIKAWRQFNGMMSGTAPIGPKPRKAMGNSALSVLGAVLLLVPGFVTAALGLVCLFGPTRALLRGIATRLMMGAALRRAGVRGPTRFASQRGFPPSFGPDFGGEQEPIKVKSTRGHPVIDGDIEK